MAASVSFYNAVGDLDVYSMLYSFFICGQWFLFYQKAINCGSYLTHGFMIHLVSS